MQYDDNMDDMDSLDWVNFIDEYHCPDYWVEVSDEFDTGFDFSDDSEDGDDDGEAQGGSCCPDEGDDGDGCCPCGAD